MKRFYICLALILGVVLEAEAQTRTLEQMTDIAAQAMQSVKKQPVTRTGTPQKRQQLTVAMNSPELAVFNADGGGWVMVSADERTNGSVLAYSPEGSFSWASAPENVKEWVDGYTKQIQSLQDIRTMSTADPNSEDGPGTPVVDALISTKWGQEYPYNLLCPSTTLRYSQDRHFLTGCTATAMAQILNFWKYDSTDAFRPIHTNNIQPSETVDFSQADYNWDNLTDTYLFKTDTVRDESGIITDFIFHPVNFNEEQANEVARLMYDCGTALDMLYDTEGGAAFTSSIFNAMLSCYDYSTDIRLVERDTFQGNWDDMLRMEFDAHRPVIYGGRAKNISYGHSFICDGYDDHGYFHFNFGWSGFCDGYYKTNAVRGKGYTFNLEQEAVIGIHPPTGNDRCVWQDGFSFLIPDTGNAVMLGYHDNGKVTKLVTPDFVDIDGKQLRIDISAFSNIKNSILKEAVLKGVVNMEKNAFQSNDNLESVTFDTCLQKMDYLALSNCSSLSRVTVQNTEPPVCNYNAFYRSKDRATLIVPEGCVPVYRNASGWNEFCYIVDEFVEDTICLTMTTLELELFNSSFEFYAVDNSYSVMMSVKSNNPVGTFSIDDIYYDFSFIIDSLGTEHIFSKADFTVSLAEDGKHYIVTGAISCSDGTVFILDLSYEKPEKTRSVTLEITDGYVVDYTNDNDVVYFWGNHLDPNIFLQLSIITDSLEGAFTLDDFYLYETLLFEKTDSTKTKYNLVDGNLTAKVEGDNVIINGKLLFRGVFNPSDVPEYTLTMVCKFVPEEFIEDECIYDFSATFSGNEIDIDTLDFENSGIVKIYANCNNNEISLYLCPESLDGGNIPAGVYNIDSSWQLGTVVASEGNDGDSYSPSYACTYIFMGYIDEIWFLKSGTVTVSYSDSIMLIDVNAMNNVGRSVKVTLTKDMTASSNPDPIPFGFSEAFAEDFRNNIGAFILYGKNSNKDQFQLAIDCDELEGTFTKDQIKPFHSLLIVYSDGNEIQYDVFAANLTITAEGDHSIITGRLAFRNSFDNTDRLDYIVNMPCFFIPREFSNDALALEFNASFSGSQVSVETQSLESDGQVLVTGKSSDNAITLAFGIGSLDEGNIPAGEYIISNSHENGTIIASDGEINKKYTPSYATDYKDKHTWFIVSGTVTVSYSDNSMLIDVDAENYRGCSVRATLTKDMVPTTVRSFKADAQSNTYDLNGRPVTDSHRGIVITDGKKHLR